MIGRATEVFATLAAQQVNAQVTRAPGVDSMARDFCFETLRVTITKH